MSEFKFACPVCGQHITADSTSSGTPLECPTCFQKIIVPQAPASGDSKFILSASKKRSARVPTIPELTAGQHSARERPLPMLVLLLFVACGLGGAWFWWRGKLLSPGGPQAKLVTNALPKTGTKPLAKPSVYDVPTNLVWTLDLAEASPPETPAAGSIHALGFVCEHATLQGGNLSLRQGQHWPPDLGLNIQLFARRGEELSGKTVEITPDRTPPLPKIVLRWKDEQQKPISKSFSSGYVLKVVFGQPANNHMPGKLYLALPDDQKSFVAGTFLANIRKPPPPKPPKPKTTPPGDGGLPP